MLLLTVTLGSDIGNIVQFNSKARGFDDFLGYLTGAEDYYMHTKSVMPTCTESNTCSVLIFGFFFRVFLGCFPVMGPIQSESFAVEWG